jgi:hypothetical protein
VTTGLEHVVWIGGGSGGGKSTIARRLAAEHGLTYYGTDDVMGDHARRTDAAESPYLYEFIGMTMDERWATRSPEVMLETFHWYRGEGFHLILEDLRRMRTGVVAEGFRLLPHLVAPLTDRAVWLLPTPEFRVAAFDARGIPWRIPSKTSDYERARHNLLERDRLFTDRMRAETARLGLPAIEVTVGAGEDALTAEVAAAVGLPATPADPGRR